MVAFFVSVETLRIAEHHPRGEPVMRIRVSARAGCKKSVTAPPPFRRE